jgi:hypothetical protein
MTALSFTVVVTKCQECPYAHWTFSERRENECVHLSAAAVGKETLAANINALTDTGPYACPMLTTNRSNKCNN